MKRRLLIAALLVTVLAAGAAGFLTSFERVPLKQQVGASGEARLRHFLAAERFAERMGLPAKELRSLPELDALDAGAVLVLPNRRQALEARRLAQILAWVERGGHLIAEAELVGVTDPLFDALGVRRNAGAPAKEIEVQLADRKLKVSMHDGLALDPGSSSLRLRAATRDAVKLASFARGKGMVTVASSLHFARNGLIGREDNAEFLWQLLQLTPASALEVYFRPERLSLWGFLVEHAAPVLAAGAAALALWLWRIAPRFGPVAPDAPPARRRLLDHLRASGRYYWAQGLRARLGEAARDAALRRLSRAQPDFAAASDAERAARLSALIAIPQEEAVRFLEPVGAMRGADFMRLAQHAQLVHSTLEKGSP